MRRSEVLDQLRANQGELRRLGAASLYLFGSSARDEARPDSDVDLFLDYADARFSLIELDILRGRVAKLLGRPVDLMTRGSLHPRLRSAIERSAVQVY